LYSCNASGPMQVINAATLYSSVCSFSLDTTSNECYTYLHCFQFWLRSPVTLNLLGIGTFPCSKTGAGVIVDTPVVVLDALSCNSCSSIGFCSVSWASSMSAHITAHFTVSFSLQMGERLIALHF
jgi:hypothetical protein